MTPHVRASLFADEQEELRVKAIWMAQYYGQAKIFKYGADHTDDDGGIYKLSGSILSIASLAGCVLQLRNVSQLTDDEAKTIADINYHSKAFSKNAIITRTDNYWNLITLKTKKGRLSIGEDRLEVDFDTPMSLQSNFGVSTVDYLRAIGILLPFTFITSTGEVKTLTVEQILALGWAVIKQD